MFGKARLFASGIMLFIVCAMSAPLQAAENAGDMAGNLQGRALINDYCTACHEVTENGGLARISEVRKTPEGWDMTLFRMQHLHGLEVDSDERLAIIKYLSQEYGLAPSEAAPFRFVLEQRAHFVDKAVNEDLDALCGRCHTNARYGLQRRTEGDWLKHMHFHVGQFPSLEYHARARDRFWWKEVTTETYKELAELYPFQTAAWETWKSTQHKSPVGKWRVTGYRPEQGGYEGIMTVKADGGYYTAEYHLKNFDGSPLNGDSKAVIYTGYEWRGAGELNEVGTREVFALSEDGNQLKGRWYEAEHYDIGGEFQAVRMSGTESRILSQTRDYIRRGESQVITLHGVELTGKITSDKGIVVKVMNRDKTFVSLEVEADKMTLPGRYKVTVGQAATEIIVYDQVDSVKVYPEWTIARLGGGKTPPVTAQFEAVAYMKGADGIIGSADDIEIGKMTAQWQAQPFDQEAEHMKDVDFAGKITQQGRYMPASAGPNPDRKYATNNAGNLKIVATVKDGDRDIEGSAHLIVTVQRWNTPPIR